jgi:predicted Fe-S protein YdhL (DUF1289 family)
VLALGYNWDSPADTVAPCNRKGYWQLNRFSTRCSRVSEQLPTRVPTPCIGVCSTGIGDVVCRGCKRYAHEVIHWNSYTEAQKRLISVRLEQFLTQIVAAKLSVFDAHLLESQLQAQQVRYSAHKSPLVWVFELLRAGAKQIADPRKFGFVVAANYRDISMATLREQIDSEFFILSEAHYQRYMGQCYSDQHNVNAAGVPSSEFDVV